MLFINSLLGKHLGQHRHGSTFKQTGVILRIKKDDKQGLFWSKKHGITVFSAMKGVKSLVANGFTVMKTVNYELELYMGNNENGSMIDAFTQALPGYRVATPLPIQFKVHDEYEGALIKKHTCLVLSVHGSEAWAWSKELGQLVVCLVSFLQK